MKMKWKTDESEKSAAEIKPPTASCAIVSDGRDALFSSLQRNHLCTRLKEINRQRMSISLVFLSCSSLLLPSLRLYLSQVNALTSFLDLFKSPVRILKDVLRILALDLSPSLPPGSPPLKWTPNVCLTLPPQAPQIFPPGYCSVFIKPEMDKILLTLQLNRVTPSSTAGKLMYHLDPPASAYLYMFYVLPS